MFTFKVQNKYDEQLELTHNSAYSIVEIDGIDPPEATINTTENAGADGSTYNSAYMNDRIITITIAINAPAETNRINLYRYFKSKFAVRLFYTNRTRDVYIDGYVQSIQIEFFEKKQIAQIVVTCPDPLFKSTNENIQAFSSTISDFEFPFDIAEEGIEFSHIELLGEKSIINKGDVETGVIITLDAIGTVVNPKIRKTDSNESMIFDGTLLRGQSLILDTRRGHKSLMLNDGSGTMINVIGYLAEGSTWFVLDPEDNLFTVTADTRAENIKASFEILDQFEGV